MRVGNANGGFDSGEASGEMTRISAVFALCAVSAFVPGVAVGTVVAMVAAAIAGLVAARAHSVADALVLGGEDAAAVVRLARFCDDLAVALALLALLYAVHPL